MLRDVVLPYLHELGERWAGGETAVAQEHFASSFIEGWMLTMARGWTQTAGRRAVLSCVPGERHTLGLIAFGLALRDLGWRVTYLGADTPVASLDRAATTVGADAVVLSAALPGTFAAAADDIRALARRHPVAMGGAGVARAQSEWLSTRTLPADPVLAAHALNTEAGPEAQEEASSEA